MRRFNNRLFYFAAAVILFTAGTSLGDIPLRRQITACFNHRGYDAVPDKAWVGSYDSVEKVVNTLDVARVKCNATDRCIAYNNLGARLIGGVIDSYVDAVGVCTYVKQVCPPKSGYKALYNTNWVGAADSIDGTATSADEAEQLCSSDDNCIGWNSRGRYLIGAADSYSRSDGTCTYMKQRCPPKAGYVLRPDMNYEGSGWQMEDGENGGQLNGGKEAQERCNLDPRCVVWNDWGYYFIGTVRSYFPYGGLCTYTKEPCIPVRGFTAYNDVTEGDVPPAGRANIKCFDDIRAQCVNNQTCTAFNDMGYYWQTDPANINPTSGYPTMCFYVRAPGFSF